MAMKQFVDPITGKTSTVNEKYISDFIKKNPSMTEYNPSMGNTTSSVQKSIDYNAAKYKEDTAKRTASIQKKYTPATPAQTVQQPAAPANVASAGTAQPGTTQDGGAVVNIRNPQGQQVTGVLIDGKTYVTGADGQRYRLPSGWEVDAPNGKTYIMGADGKGYEKPQAATDVAANAQAGGTAGTVPAAGAGKEELSQWLAEQLAPLTSQLEQVMGAQTSSEDIQGMITEQTAPIGQSIEDLKASREGLNQQLGELSNPQTLSDITAQIMEGNQPLIEQRKQALMESQDQAIKSMLANMESRGLVNSGVASVLENELRQNYASAVDTMIAELQSDTQQLASQHLDRMLNTIGLQGDWAGQDLSTISSAIADSVGLQLKGQQLAQDDRQFYDSLNQSDKQFYASLGQDDRQFYKKLSQSDQQFYASLSQDDKQFMDNLQLGKDKLEEDARQFNENLAFNAAKLRQTLASDAAARDMQMSMFLSEMGYKTKQLSLDERMMALNARNELLKYDLDRKQFESDKAYRDYQINTGKAQDTMSILEYGNMLKTQGASSEEIEDAMNGMFAMAGIETDEFISSYISDLGAADEVETGRIKAWAESKAETPSPNYDYGSGGTSGINEGMDYYFGNY
jgi:hypothetical protein